IATVIGVLLVVFFNTQKGSLMSIHYKGIMTIIPAIVTTIFLGAFWKRFTAPAACIAMVAGSLLTLLTNKYPGMIDHLAWYVGGPQNGKYIYMRALFGMSATAIIGVIVTFLTQPRKKDEIAGLTIDTLDDAMKNYKGGEPHHEVGEKVRRLNVEVDESIPYEQIALSSSVLERMKAVEGDMIYAEDSRWYLGGLRSIHLKAAPAHDGDEEVVRISTETFTEAYFVKGNPVTLEKIF
ncbi:MAG: hypothetical protein AAF492_12515, partial [Verrucomicrobiota bacterium]